MNQLHARAGEAGPRLIASRRPGQHRRRPRWRCTVASPRPWPEVVEQDIEDFRRHWSSPQLREGIEAFLGKREPRYGPA